MAPQQRHGDARPRRRRRAGTRPRRPVSHWPSASAAGMSSSASGPWPVTASVRTHLIARSKYPPGGAPSSGHRRTRGVLRRGVRAASRLRPGHGPVGPTGRRRAAPPFVASHAFPTRPPGAPRYAQRTGQRVTSDGHAGDLHGRRCCSSTWSPRSSAAAAGRPARLRQRFAEDPASSSVAAREAIPQASGLDDAPGVIAR